MKNWIAITLSFLCMQCYAQLMHIKQPNFGSFRQNEKNITPFLEINTSDSAKLHPEYGTLPFNAPCKECIELLDQRTIDARVFMDAVKPGRIYAQKSYYPMHYKKSAADVWHTIDHRLSPDVNNKGIYAARNQPVPTQYDVNKNTTSVIAHGLQLEFNKNLAIYFFDEGVAYTQPTVASYRNLSIGGDGIKVNNIWKGIDMTQVFSPGSVETSYIISSPLQLPISSGWMVIEDHFTLPAGIHIEEAADGKHKESGYYSGNYLLKNESGDTVFMIERPTYMDVRSFGMHGSYKLMQSGNNCTLQTMVPVSWLASKDNQYPICIDPQVSGHSQYGAYNSSGNPGADEGFTSMNLGSGFCPYQLTVNLNQGFAPVSTYAELEYYLTQDNTCGTPPEPAPYCPFSQVTQTILNNDCNTSTGVLNCNQVGGFLSDGVGSRYCSTDSGFNPASHSILIDNLPGGSAFLSCEGDRVSCQQLQLSFTLKNQDSICQDACGYLCARGNLWRMTVVGQSFTMALVPFTQQIVAGQPGTVTAVPTADGVRPYTYQWTVNGQPVADIDSLLTLTVTQNDTISCLMTDNCGSKDSSTAYMFVFGPPIADPGADTSVCNGGSITLGGHTNPTPADTILWTAQPPAQQGWISNSAIYHPVLTIPQGIIGTFTFTLTVSDSLSTDSSVTITSLPNPTVTIDGDTLLGCAGGSVFLWAAANEPVSYLWNTGSTSDTIVVTQPGSFYVIVTDQNNCIDTSSRDSVIQTPPPTVQIFPDTTIKYGDSVMLYAQPSLDGAGIDSFRWYGQNGLSCDSCLFPIVTPLNSQIYGIQVYSEGCMVTDSIYIQVVLPVNFFIPNVFSPNNDGSDDYFYIFAQPGVKVLSFEVYDRIGEKIHDAQYPWDGTFKGKPQPPGTYVYVFKLQMYGTDNTILKKGTVTLLR